MKINKIFNYCIFSILSIIFLINFACSQTLVAGKVYNSGYDNFVSEVYVSVNCNSNLLTTHTLEDGTYAVRFEENDCNLGESVEVKASKGDLSGSANGIIIECDGSNNCNSGYFSVINLAIKSQTSESSSGGGGGRYYYCGNNKCDSGESFTTCPKDCKITTNQNITNITSVSNITNQNIQTDAGENSGSEIQAENLDNETEPNKSSFSKITGAVTGVAGKLGAGWIIVIIFIFVVLILSLIVRVIRKRRVITNKIQRFYL